MLDSGTASGELVAPARVVLKHAEHTYRLSGHENDGFLSDRRGFMPRAEPLSALPHDFEVWDRCAAVLPALYGSLALRRELDALPDLSGAARELPDAALLRACHLLGMLAHAYQYVETRPPERLPAAITGPWTVVLRRLGREEPVLSYIDLIVYNYRFLESTDPDPFRVENLRLSTPTVDTAEERRFYLTQTEILGQTAPIVGAVARAQQAVLERDATQLERELWLITERLAHVVRVSLAKIDPNPAAPSHVDPIVWAKTVAPFAVPMRKGVQGPSGTSSPLFNLLDAFFGRKRHASFLGREIKDLRRSYPRLWVEFLEAVERVSVAEYVAGAGSAELSGLFAECFETYAGRNGFLGRHRMKVYGYLELAFKVGREVTIGGFSGLFKDRTWDQVDAELELSRRERLEAFPEVCHVARLGAAAAGRTGDSACPVRLDVEGNGVRYEPGARCGILAENAGALVSRTLLALGATGSERVELSSEWREHVRLRPGYGERTTLSLRELLRFGKIRPVTPRVAEALHALTQLPALRAAILEQTTARWELWELLLEVRESGFELSRLWSAEPSASGYVARVIPPENFRMYSISSAMRPGQRAAREVELTVGVVRYRASRSARAPELVRRGTASNYLAEPRSEPVAVPFVLQHPTRFRMPDDPSVPIVMLAGGTGIAPFLSFIRARRHAGRAGSAWLYWGLRTRADLLAEAELVRAVAEGWLRVEIVFSQEPLRASIERVPGRSDAVTYEPAAPQRLDRLLLAGDTPRRLLDLVTSRNEGGQGAHLYVCGRTRFAHTMDETFHRLLAEQVCFGDRAQAGELVARLAAEGRYLREVYTEPRPDDPALPRLDVSTVIDKNDESSGYWLVVDGRVYDLTSFVRMHPGGSQVLRGYAGLDATQGYVRAHAQATDVDAMRDMYVIGRIRPLAFGDEARVVEREQVTHHTSVAALYRSWVAFTYLVVEMQNALAADFGFRTKVTARDEAVTPPSPYKLERAVETQERFFAGYVGLLAGSAAANLWELLEGLCRGRASSTFRMQLETVQQSDAAAYVRSVPVVLRAELARCVGQGDRSELPRAWVAARDVLEVAALELLVRVKALLRRGLLLFEGHEAAVLERAGNQLMAELRTLPEELARYSSTVATRLQALGYAPRFGCAPAMPVRQSERGHAVLTFNRYWLLELDTERNIVFLRRSAAPLRSIEDLVLENETLLASVRATSTCPGAIVDTRQAPLRNDVEFEEAMRRMRNEVCRSYRRVAVLLASSAGVLQVQRLGRDEDAPTLVTQSEDAAVKFVLGEA